MDPNSAATVGLLNAFRTGNVVVDTMLSSVLCMFLPLLLTKANAVFQKGSTHASNLWSWLTQTEDGDEYTRVIEYVEKTTSWGSVMDTVDEKNNILQKAITMQLSRANINYNTCDLKLTVVRSRYEPQSEGNGSDSDSEDECASSNTSDVYGNTADQLKAYEITKMPPLDEWVEIGNGLKFRQSTGNPDKEGKDDGEEKKKDTSDRFSQKRVRFEISCDDEDGEERVETWVANAYKLYCEEIAKSAASILGCVSLATCLVMCLT